MATGAPGPVAWRATGEGPPVLLVMGIGGAGRAWWRLVPRLEEAARTITFDHRGTGTSPRLDARGIAFEGLVADALAVLDLAEVERAHVVGISLGGMVAQALALDHRDRVASLSLLATTPAAGAGGPPWPLLAAGAARGLLGAERAKPLRLRALYARRTREEHPDRIDADLADELVEPTPPWTAVAQLGAVAGFDARPRLRELRGLPTLVVHGLEDVVFPPDRGRELAAAIPGSRLVLLDDAAHVLTTDADDRLPSLILSHIKDVEQPS